MMASLLDAVRLKGRLLAYPTAVLILRLVLCWACSLDLECLCIRSACSSIEYSLESINVDCELNHKLLTRRRYRRATVARSPCFLRSQS